jgi:hypothetical protein
MSSPANPPSLQNVDKLFPSTSSRILPPDKPLITGSKEVVVRFTIQTPILSSKTSKTVCWFLYFISWLDATVIERVMRKYFVHIGLG